eukprot:403366506
MSQFGATFGNSRGFKGDTHNNKFNDSFDRDSDDFGFNNDLSNDLGYGKNQLNKTHKKQGGAKNVGNQFDAFNSQQQNRAAPSRGLRNQFDRGMNGPPLKSSISDIVDKKEKDAIFKSSMMPGGYFGGMNQVPGQSYTPFLSSPKGTSMDQLQKSGTMFNFASNFGSPIQSPQKAITESFKKFMPRSEKEKFKQKMLEEIKDFQYHPKRFMCKKHKNSEVQFCCSINETFFCKLCMPQHQGHDDMVLSQVCEDIQHEVIKLKHTYKAKKEFIINKLDQHQENIEKVFKVYYDTLDECRAQVLGQEYKLRENMDYFEKTIAELMHEIKKYNYVEFYHEQDALKSKVKDIKDHLKAFMRETNHSFSLENYEYILNQQQNPDISKVYKQLGPFDYYTEKIDEETAETKTLVGKFDTRKSGTQFRGEISSITGKPDGKGIKVFPNGSIYEGFFADGHCHGLGRGITSRGEVFQGQFKFDVMEGKGFYQWPDGRMYDGEWKAGKKSGQGKFFWPNGQVYEGDFKDNECNGAGILHYTDGKKLEGVWRNGKKHGKAVYVWPNGARYNVFYIDGKKQGEGMLENTNVSLEQLKDNYRSLAKKSLQGKQLLDMKPTSIY